MEKKGYNVAGKVELNIMSETVEKKGSIFVKS